MTMRSIMTTILEVVGLATIVIGCGLAWLPLGLITAGAALVTIGLLNS